MNDVMWLKFYKYIDHLLLLGTPVRRSYSVGCLIKENDL